MVLAGDFAKTVHDEVVMWKVERGKRKVESGKWKVDENGQRREERFQ